MDYQPLPEKMRPKKLEDVIGQQHLLAPQKPLRAMLEANKPRSMVLWGPPGTGKTTIARLFAQSANLKFVEFSAVTSGIPEIRKIISEAKETYEVTGQPIILFIDEIHRFTKAQQDAFLPHMESGLIILIGATTENPGFEVIGPLLSRSQVYHFESLSDEDILKLLKRASKEFTDYKFEPKAIEFLAKQANGDARTALNSLEAAANLSDNDKVTVAIAELASQRKAALYDKKGDNHYDTISAFIKSMRGSDPDAALHYLARMLESGEDPMFIARRMVIFASEDIGNTLPTALVVATSAMQATHMVGLPEARIILAQAATYLASAPKSRAVIRGIDAAQYDIRNTRLEPIPMHLRNPVNRVVKDLGAGEGYNWPEKDGDSTTNLGFLPKNLQGKKYYNKPEK